MIEELAIKDLGVIEHATISFGSGMSVVTGETGAGKTLLVTALTLLLGDRTNASVVRTGSDEASVSVRLMNDSGEETIVRRVVSSSGRSKAYVNDSPVTVAELQRIVSELLEITGQNTQQGLLRVSEQRDALDSFGGIDTSKLLSLRDELREAENALKAAAGDPREAQRELDLLKFQVKELDAANLTNPNEDDELAAQEQILANAVGLREKGNQALELLEAEGGAYDSTASAVAALKDEPAFDSNRVQLTELAESLHEFVRDFRSQIESISDDPATLQEIQDRRAVLTQLRRKYGEQLSEVMEFHRQVSERILFLENLDSQTAALRSKIEALNESVAKESASIRKAREKFAGPMAKGVEAFLKSLALAHAKFKIQLDDSPAGDGVSLLFSANPGMDPAPLSKAASGGELSRVMLAIRLVSMRDDGITRTLVFDEVDAGVGGEAALAVAKALVALARIHQVLLVTHLPQIAAYADQQINVKKVVNNGATTASISVVEGDDRVIELSRMLSGQPESKNAHEHAAELLDLAAEERKTLSRAARR